jgi:hypothetical protein
MSTKIKGRFSKTLAPTNAFYGFYGSCNKILLSAANNEKYTRKDCKH